jgi:hypothetical protein
MVTRPFHSPRHQGGLQIDLVVALGLCLLAVLPLAYGYLHHQRTVRFTTVRMVAAELADGELEVLAAGEHRAVSPGSQPWTVHGPAAASLPQGRWSLTRQSTPEGSITLALEWRPESSRGPEPVRRSIQFKPSR